ncbi:MAG TPA: prolyl-tRNA synthetase associated domain-containing protein [Candidatus Limosilactobacillus excrementigallinarum]|nr:prolyl-tRNA synthetase associated domain-containing protein [Candidatus Limosilactobacillus excrementigallinarum]
MDEKATLKYLERMRINYELVTHPAIFNMAEAEAVKLPHPEAEAKNLFICDDKGNHYYLLTVQGTKRVDLKKFRRQFDTRRLHFASADDLKRYLGITPGEVTPLGLLNDDACKVSWYLDHYFTTQPLIGVHPNTNTSTIWLNPTDLVFLIHHHGNDIHITGFE